MYLQSPEVEGDSIFNISNEQAFEDIALKLFRFQYHNNSLYGEFCRHLGIDPGAVQTVAQIPFLPISFFKTHEVRSLKGSPETIFYSSGTTAQTRSRHLVFHPDLYIESFLRSFRQFIGDPEDLCILALLPAYGSGGTSSLVYMVNELIGRSKHPRTGFYADDKKGLLNAINEVEQEGGPGLLIGVTWALLDLAEQHPLSIKNFRIMETGGMKGRKREPIREELYDELRKGFGINDIYSEYGMTELFSQAYAVNGIYQTPAWMRIQLRDETDPLAPATGSSGAINVIDLANRDTCSFIATEDIGRKVEGGYQILGRLDNTDIRGCSLMVV